MVCLSKLFQTMVPNLCLMSFSTFMHADGVKHIRCAPYHPSSNGAAKWFVRTFKESMKVVHHEGQTTQHSIANFLLTYWSTPHSTIGVRCNALFTVPGKECKDSAGLIQPDLEKTVGEKQVLHRKQHDQHGHE